ncbi:uncharacterized protein LOC114338545 isoform X1 [Diabrotica virgifera virgifera]|uniref:Malate dehydrogenase, chloroplastic-like isoform X1 n=1 Tax=Diabrotica virgifera virgifera TaxID=50390 RepID=A0A6P7GMC4_DIAVI|nr:uncharacterized protein LOC114338545 isoform X1 [Diabrotica virgifera virgifera]
MLKFLTHKLRTHSINEDNYAGKADEDHDSGTESDEEIDAPVSGSASCSERVCNVSPADTGCSMESPAPDQHDAHSSEEELEVINSNSKMRRSTAPPRPLRAASVCLAEKRKWSQIGDAQNRRYTPENEENMSHYSNLSPSPCSPFHIKCCSEDGGHHIEHSGSSDDEVHHFLYTRATPVQFRTSPPLEAVKPERRSIVTSKGRSTSPPAKLLHYEDSPRKRTKHMKHAHIQRPYLDFEKMQQGADVVVTVGGDKVSPEETFEEIFNRNVNDVRITALHLAEFNPKGIVCIARPPVEALVPLVSEEFKKAGVYDWKKIFGVTTIAAMRSNSILAAKTKHKPLDMVCPIAGGLSNECFVPVISQVRPKIAVNGRELRQQIFNSEHDILKLYCEKKVVCLTPALAISRFINTLLKTLKGQTNCAECAFVRQMGHIGNFLPYMTSIVRLSRHGILSSHMPNVDGEETVLLQQMAIRIKQYIKHGESFVTGEPQTVKEKLPKPQDIQIKTYAQKSPKPDIVNAS